MLPCGAHSRCCSTDRACDCVNRPHPTCCWRRSKTSRRRQCSKHSSTSGSCASSKCSQCSRSCGISCTSCSSIQGSTPSSNRSSRQPNSTCYSQCYRWCHYSACHSSCDTSCNSSHHSWRSSVASHKRHRRFNHSPCSSGTHSTHDSSSSSRVRCNPSCSRHWYDPFRCQPYSSSSCSSSKVTRERRHVWKPPETQRARYFFNRSEPWQRAVSTVRGEPIWLHCARDAQHFGDRVCRHRGYGRKLCQVLASHRWQPEPFLGHAGEGGGGTALPRGGVDRSAL